MLAPEDMPPRYPLADQIDTGGWDRAGRCHCGNRLAPHREWHWAGASWAHTRCSGCGTRYVDEEDYIAVYDQDDYDAEPCECEETPDA